MRLVNRAMELRRRDGDTAEIDAYNDLDGRFGTDEHPAVREQVARALFNQGVIRFCAGQTAQADRLWTRALDTPSLWLLVTLAPVLAARNELGPCARADHHGAAALGFAEWSVHLTAFLDDVEEARTVRPRPSELADDGDSDAMNCLGLLARCGLPADARSWWKASQPEQDAAARVLLHLLDGAD